MGAGGSGGNQKTALSSPPNSRKNKKGYIMENEKKREYSPDDYVLCFPDNEKYIVVNDSYSRFYPETGEYSFKSTDGLKITMPYDKFRHWKYEKAQKYEKEIRNKVTQVDSVSILGTPYKIIREKFGNEDCDGETDYTSHQIRIRTDNINEVGDFDSMMKKQLRHEIIHAFMAESGLQANFEHYRQFGHDETTVDWFAIQFPKILEAFKQVGAL